MAPILVWIYLIGAQVTLAVLMWQDWRHIDSALDFLVIVSANLYLSGIWPIHWGILHWFFG